MTGWIRSVLACAVVLVCAAPAVAQPTGGPGPTRNRIHVDVQPVGVTVGYARTLSGGPAIGGEIGVGGNFLEYMLVAGRHFSEDGGLAYEDRDASTDALLFEMLSLSVFVRPARTGNWDVDAGMRASAFLHFDSSDDDPGGGVFAGLYTTALYGWRAVKFGPRLMVGAFSEGPDTTEFGMHAALLIGRITFGW